VTPEEYRILFGEDPPELRATPAAPRSGEPWVDPRPWWRKKRVQFPASILVMITLLSFDDGDRPDAPERPRIDAVPTAQP
jgi:hypothetical protein